MKSPAVPDEGALVALQTAIENAYQGTSYRVERLPDGVALTVGLGALVTGAPLTTGQQQTVRIHVVADAPVRTYRLRVTSRTVRWELPGLSIGSVRVTTAPGRMKISATLRGTDLSGGFGVQHFVYDTDTDAARVQQALAPLGWTRATARVGRVLGLVGAGVVVALGLVLGVLIGTGVL